MSCRLNEADAVRVCVETVIDIAEERHVVAEARFPESPTLAGRLAALAVIVGAGYTVAVMRDDENAAGSDAAVPETRPTAAPTSPVVAIDTAAPPSDASPVADDPGTPATATAALARFLAD